MSTPPPENTPPETPPQETDPPVHRPVSRKVLAEAKLDRTEPDKPPPGYWTVSLGRAALVCEECGALVVDFEQHTIAHRRPPYP